MPWISWPQLKSKAGAQGGYGEPWPAAATVAAPSLVIAPRICEQGLPGVIPSWHKCAACALSPHVTSQKVLLYKTYDWVLSPVFLGVKKIS